MSDGSMRFREALSWGKTRMHSSAGHVCGKPKDIRANQNGACSSNAQDRHSMPGRGLEPLRISPPDPKSGASANFATLAIRFRSVNFQLAIANDGGHHRGRIIASTTKRRRAQAWLKWKTWPG